MFRWFEFAVDWLGDMIARLINRAWSWWTLVPGYLLWTWLGAIGGIIGLYWWSWSR